MCLYRNRWKPKYIIVYASKIYLWYTHFISAPIKVVNILIYNPFEMNMNARIYYLFMYYLWSTHFLSAPIKELNIRFIRLKTTKTISNISSKYSNYKFFSFLYCNEIFIKVIKPPICGDFYLFGIWPIIFIYLFLLYFVLYYLLIII